MNERNPRSSRRAFFLQGGAALGAGVATTVGASTFAEGTAASQAGELEQLRAKLDLEQDREALRKLHVTFTALLEKRVWTDAAELFDEQAHVDLSGVRADGKSAIRKLFVEQYGEQTASVIHGAYRPNASQRQDMLAIDEKRLHATAIWHVDVQLSTPLQGDCTAVQMARLQGQMADCRWEAGRLEAKYVKTQGQWRIASLSYRAA